MKAADARMATAPDTPITLDRIVPFRKTDIRRTPNSLVKQEKYHSRLNVMFRIPGIRGFKIVASVSASYIPRHSKT